MDPDQQARTPKVAANQGTRRRLVSALLGTLVITAVVLALAYCFLMALGYWGIAGAVGSFRGG